MTHRALLTALFTGAALTAAPAGAQGVAGTWQIESETQRGSLTQTLVLAVEGSTLTGTITFGGGGRRGGGRGPGTIEISDGMVDGETFSFNVALDFGGNSITLSYSGTVDGDSIEGTREGGRGGGALFMGTRGG